MALTHLHGYGNGRNNKIIIVFFTDQRQLSCVEHPELDRSHQTDRMEPDHISGWQR